MYCLVFSNDTYSLLAVNHATGGTVTESFSTKTHLNDGRDDTCGYTGPGTEQTVAVVFTVKRWITEMEITTKRNTVTGNVLMISVIRLQTTTDIELSKRMIRQFWK